MFILKPGSRLLKITRPDTGSWLSDFGSKGKMAKKYIVVVGLLYGAANFTRNERYHGFGSCKNSGTPNICSPQANKQTNKKKPVPYTL
jgi:hypothetical protein